MPDRPLRAPPFAISWLVSWLVGLLIVGELFVQGPMSMLQVLLTGLAALVFTALDRAAR